MSDLYSKEIHEWFHQKFPDPNTGAYLNFDEVITIIQEPNIKIFYKEELIRIACWFTYGGAAPAEFQVLYADPKMFEKLEKVLEYWVKLEQKYKESYGFKRGEHDKTLPEGVLD